MTIVWGEGVWGPGVWGPGVWAEEGVSTATLRTRLDPLRGPAPGRLIVTMGVARTPRMGVTPAPTGPGVADTPTGPNV